MLDIFNTRPSQSCEMWWEEEVKLWKLWLPNSRFVSNINSWSF